MSLRRCSIGLASLFVLALFACAHAGNFPTPAPTPNPDPPDPPSGPALDQYGGRTDIACSSGAKGYFYTQKIGAHWYFCDPLGNAFVAMSVSNILTNSEPTFDCTHQPAGTASSVAWSGGDATFTFSAPLPSDAVTGNALNTSGFAPSAYNLANAKITSANSSDGTVTVSLSSNPGSVTTLGSGSFDVDTYPIYNAKYGGTSYNWGWQSLKRAASWGFNSIGQDSTGDVQPWETCSGCVWPGGSQPIKMPYISELRPAEYAAINKFGYLTEGIKDLISGANSNYSTWRGGALFDDFDSKLNTELQTELAEQTQPSYVNMRDNYPYLLAIFTSDSDWFQGFGAGPDFNSGESNPNIGYITLITSPVQTMNKTPAFATSATLLYQTTEVFSKAQATNPSTVCSVTSPCSLRDYLWQKYTDNPPACASGAAAGIASLNKCWGSNYTTFDSTGVQITGETIGTGDGSTTTFTHTLAHAPVSPLSVLISVGGAAQIGDCPWFHPDCSSPPANTGNLYSPSASYIFASTIDYSTGAVTLTFTAAPPSGTAITVDYVNNGWMSGGTGLMDESGSGSWVGTNNFCLEGADPNFPTYFACIGSGGKPVPNANVNLGADLDNWIPEFSARFFKTMHDDIKAVTQVPYFGLDNLGNYGAPPYSKVLEGAAPYLDGAFVNIQYWFPKPSPALFYTAYQYLTRYIGDLPLMNFSVISAVADSSYHCYTGGVNDQPTQNIRGQVWYDTVAYLLSTNGYNGDTQFVGFDWWSWQDFQDINQGIISLHDNAYDGAEDVAASVPCDSSYSSAASCGGENETYGNAITEPGGIAAANLLWLGGSARPTAISKRAVIWSSNRRRASSLRTLQGRESALPTRP